MASYSLDVGLWKYNLLMDVVGIISKVENILCFKRFCVVYERVFDFQIGIAYHFEIE